MNNVQGFLPYIVSAILAAGTAYYFANKKSKSIYHYGNLLSKIFI